MSHWTKIGTKISEMDALKKALERMGLEYSEGKHSIKQYNTTEKAEIKLDDAVGFSRQKDGTFSMVGDFYHSRNPKLRRYYSNTQNFTDDLQTAYAIEESTLRMEEQQFTCTENSEGAVGEDGLIRMTFERF